MATLHPISVLLAALWIFQTPVVVLAQSKTGEAIDRFEQFDKNQDGRIDPKELPRPTLFRLLDRDQDGLLTPEEAQRFNGASTTRSRAARAPDGFHGHLHRDMRYASAEGVNPTSLSLDIYQPREVEQAPVMIYVHGGGWSKGDKQAVGEKPAYFESKGWLMVSVNYRLLPAGRHPVNVQDLAQAITWVEQHIADYGGDPDQIYLMGHSAGAHLVSLVATDERRLAQAGTELSVLRGVISLDTNAYDLPVLLKERGAELYKEVFGETETTLKDASPLHHVKTGTEIPPFVICFSRGMAAFKDPMRSRQALAFAESLKKAGIPATVVDGSDRNHGEINAWFGRNGDPVTQKAMDFLSSQRKSIP